MDALYMTIITPATVGYSEVHAIRGPGRIFTLVLIILGVGYFLYVESGCLYRGRQRQKHHRGRSYALQVRPKNSGSMQMAGIAPLI